MTFELLCTGSLIIGCNGCIKLIHSCSLCLSRNVITLGLIVADVDHCSCGILRSSILGSLLHPFWVPHVKSMGFFLEMKGSEDFG